jgi:hypothetical protein
MGKRDITRRESKKPKRGEKKPPVVSDLEPTADPELVRRRRKTEDGSVE